ncbi:polyprenyl synthetase family protein [Peribacillus saganii]|uniref:Farnesyl diphosphate synthase n=1 Tax=Peribacillus saganii TaxID=2303992 RepID=A0A372LPD2_9BACI|nr:farnesyl diphosphate synthase [Peribacillus saganii]RFU69798.1 polyprenyl synthetase family protein [Peribacillus saganii]
MNFQSFSETYKRALEQEMQSQISKLHAPNSLKEAMLYSLEAGGKRIRPMLVFAVLEAFGQNPDRGISVAAAIEMIHTYSLIHDDLPSMDDDDLRRGKPTNHKVFGEATAILAGDALLTYSFQAIAEIDMEGVTPMMQLELIKLLSRSAGAEGMVGGQMADIEAEGKHLALESLEYIHSNKTGKLLSASILAGAILAEASERQKTLLLEFSRHLGLAFQIRDDILDIEGSQEKIGKPVGSDTANSKSTYPALLSMDGAKEKLSIHIEQALLSLAKSGINTELLEEVTEMIAARDH